MGQKVNPIAVRLNFNRFSDSSWFSDYYYSRLLYQDFNFRQYLNSVKLPNANKLGFRGARCIIHHFPKKTLIHLFCLSDPRQKVVDTHQKRSETIPLATLVKTNELHSSLGSFVVEASPFEGPREVNPPPRSFNNNAEEHLTSTESLNIESGYKNRNEEDRNSIRKPMETESFSIYNHYSGAVKENASKAEVSLYWLKSSMLEKKRALINLHRGIAKSFTELRYNPLEEPSEKGKKNPIPISGCPAAFPSAVDQLYQGSVSRSLPQAPLKTTPGLDKIFVRQSSLSKSQLPLRPGWLFRLAPIVSTNFFDFTSILFSTKSYNKSNFSEFADVKNLHGTMWSAINSFSTTKDSSLDRRSPWEAPPLVALENHESPDHLYGSKSSVPLKLDIFNGPDSYLRIRAYFSFYAMHFFFMRKTNSFYLSKHAQRPSRYFDGVSAQSYEQEIKAIQTKSETRRSGSGERSPSCSAPSSHSFLCFSPNTIWPSLHNIYESRNCAVWKLLSLDWPTNLSTIRNRVPQSSDNVFKSFLNMKRNDTKNKKLSHPENKNVVGNSVVRVHGPSKIMKSLDFYLSNVHFILSENSKIFISLRAIKVNSVFQSAFLVAQEVACKLEQKKSFRLICRLIFQQISSCNYIKGIRIACSGRLNGAEIAKTECRKFGETSLHIFSDKIDYAHTTASTPYGILGIKVWISYI